MRRRHWNTLEPIFRHPVPGGNIPRWQIEALVMTITIHGGKGGDAPTRELHPSAGLLRFEGADSLASPLGHTLVSARTYLARLWNTLA